MHSAQYRYDQTLGDQLPDMLIVILIQLFNSSCQIFDGNLFAFGSKNTMVQVGKVGGV